MNRRQQAERVGAALPDSRLHPAVLTWLGRSRRRVPWCVAVSGGADSVALLLVLWARWPERRADLMVLHFNHRLRGAASDADERFVRRLARDLRVRCRTGRWRRPPAHPSEAAARQARHEFFQRAMARCGSRTLWLAQQQDDVAESLLMRLARGSGTGGLAAPRPVQEFADGRVHLRPLLTLRREELEWALRGAKIAWRIDRSNAGEDYLRNRVRRSVVPVWAKAAQRDAVAGAALSRDLLEEDDAALETWAGQVRALHRRRLDVAEANRVPRAVRRRLLHRWLLAAGPRTDLSRQGFGVLLAAVERGTSTRLSLGNGFAVIQSGKLGFVPGRRVANSK